MREIPAQWAELRQFEPPRHGLERAAACAVVVAGAATDVCEAATTPPPTESASRAATFSL